MAGTAKKTEKTNQNKNIIFGICAAIVAVAIIVVAIVLITSNNKLNDSYFVSDGTKYVLTINADDLSTGDAEVTPIKAHVVYYYSGDAITGIKSYYEFTDNAAAQKAYNHAIENGAKDAYKEIVVDGKYVVMTSNEADYDGLTASDVKNQIDFVQSQQSINANPEGTVEETTTETTTEGTPAE